MFPVAVIAPVTANVLPFHVKSVAPATPVVDCATTILVFAPFNKLIPGPVGPCVPVPVAPVGP